MSSQPLEVPRLKGEALKFAQNVVAIRMPYPQAVRAFLESFPEYLENDKLSEEEIVETLKERFQRMRHDHSRVSYHKIKETEATLKDLLDCIPISSPLKRLMALDKRHQDLCDKIDVDDEKQKLGVEEELKVMATEIKVLSAAATEVERLMPRERRSPFTGLPDLIPTQTSEPSQTPDETDKSEEYDLMSGAMKKHVNTG